MRLVYHPHTQLARHGLHHPQCQGFKVPELFKLWQTVWPLNDTVLQTCRGHAQACQLQGKLQVVHVADA